MSCFGKDKQGIYFTIYKTFSASPSSYKVNLRCLGEVMILSHLKEKSMLIQPERSYPALQAHPGRHKLSSMDAEER